MIKLLRALKKPAFKQDNPESLPVDTQQQLTPVDKQKQALCLQILPEILLGIASELERRDVIALSQTCRLLYGYRFSLKEASAKKHYSHIPPRKNWETLWDALCLGDLYVSQQLLKTFSWQIAYAAILGLMNKDFLAQKGLSPGRLTSEDLVYNLLFTKEEEGGVFSKHLSNIRLVSDNTKAPESDVQVGSTLFLLDVARVTGLSVQFLGAFTEENLNQADTAQTLLIGAIAGGYLTVAEKLINDLKIKPERLAMIRFLCQATRRPSWKKFFELFQKNNPQTKQAGKDLINGFINLEVIIAEDSLSDGNASNEPFMDDSIINCAIHEPGYQSLRVEVATLLKQSYKRSTSVESVQNLFAVNIKLGRINKIRSFLEERHLWPEFDSFVEGAWMSLCKADSNKAAEMLAYWQSLYIKTQSKENSYSGQGILISHVKTGTLVDFQNDTVNILLTKGYLKVVMWAHRINHAAYPKRFSHSEETAVLSFVEALHINNFAILTEQAIQGGYLKLLAGISAFKEKYCGWLSSTAKKIANDEESKRLYNRYVSLEHSIFSGQSLSLGIQYLSFQEIQASLETFNPKGYRVRSNALKKWLQGASDTQNNGSCIIEGANLLAREVRMSPRSTSQRLPTILYKELLLILSGSLLNFLAGLSKQALKPIIQADRLDVMLWYLEYQKPKHQNAIEDGQKRVLKSVWESICKQAIKSDSPILFEAALKELEHCSIEKNWEASIEYGSVEVIRYLIRSNGYANYQKLLSQLLNRLVSDKELLATGPTQWWPLFQTLFKYHQGNLEVNCLRMLTGFIEENMHEFYIHFYEGWMRLLLRLAREVSHHITDKATLKDEVLKLLVENSQSHNQRLSKSLEILVDWLKSDDPSFNLNKLSLKPLVTELLEQSLPHFPRLNAGFLNTVVYLFIRYPTKKKNIQNLIVDSVLIQKRSDLLQQLVESQSINPNILKEEAHKARIIRYCDYQFFGESTREHLASVLGINPNSDERALTYRPA